MGWWNAPENPEIMVGDAVLDTVRHFLRDFSSEFQEDLSSKPTLQELGYALNLAFKVNVDSDVVSGFDGLEVKEVLIKTAKRKKRQKVMPGDVFAYKLDDRRYGFGRIIAKVSIGAIAEIFDHFSSQPVLDHGTKKEWLIPPVPIDCYSLLEIGDMGDWRIIERQPGFVPGEHFQLVEICIWSSAICARRYGHFRK
ncbi:Imm26 family immunity protein [Massilia sp. YIM B02443]|uniref:Imm26 family immunity protein n=1 Tax=Massilia sp. YIM B02443 TaxID=3050127 RepID=UPI0025B6B973|nr:Imm26 family immunity protein [Massilia sp. YIM B02443]MDN4038154.1 Imm26 family immunity protein [Massilia sp. YIM B02443]